MAIVATSPPAVEYVIPVDNATGIAIDSNITVRFKDSIKAGSGHIVISNGRGDTRRIAIHDSTQVQIGTVDDAMNASKYGTPRDRTLVINPRDNLLSGSGYFVQLDSGVITSASGAPLAGVSDTTTYNFTTSTDTFAPMPLSGEYSQDLLGVRGIVAVFNEPIKKGNGEAVVTNKQGDTFAMNIEVMNNTVMLTNPVLLPNTHYFLTLDAGAITDLAGNPFAGVTATHPFNFKTPNHSDALTAAIGLPNNDDAVSVGTDIPVWFNLPIQIGSGEITLSNGQGDTRHIPVNDTSQITLGKSIDKFSGGKSYLLMINPAQLLSPNSQYTLQIPAGVVTDLGGNPFAGLMGEQATHLKTLGLDPTPPVPVQTALITEINDGEKRQHVSVSTTIQATFDDLIRAGTGNITLSNGQNDVRIISATDSTQVSVNDHYLIITPTKKLLPDSRYFVLVDKGAIINLEGMAFAGVQDKAAFTFKTEALWAKSGLSVIEINRGGRVGHYENTDVLVFHFSKPVKTYTAFKLNQHTFGGNDVTLSADDMSAWVELTADATVTAGDILTIEGASGGLGEDGVVSQANVEFKL